MLVDVHPASSRAEKRRARNFAVDLMRARYQPSAPQIRIVLASAGRRADGPIRVPARHRRERELPADCAGPAVSTLIRRFILLRPQRLAWFAATRLAGLIGFTLRTEEPLDLRPH
jgi:hypothetical protein